jgi:hypothetical protein
MPRGFAASLLFTACAVLLSVRAAGQTPEALNAVIQRLSKEADLFDRQAHRVAGIETLRQTLPKGSRVTKGKRGVEVALPEQKREIVSEYGFIGLDERGGWLKEVRIVRTVDGAKWKKGNKGLDSLARMLSASDDKKKKSLLESFERFGLHGFITDLGQLILLFARGLVSNYEVTFDSRDLGDPRRPLDVYRYTQLGGGDALTVYEGKAPLRLKLQGKIWVRSTEGHVPVRISIDNIRQENKNVIRDVSVVDYESTQFGFLLPAKIKHQQFVGDRLFVEDDFTYSDFKQVLPGVSR